MTLAMHLIARWGTKETIAKRTSTSAKEAILATMEYAQIHSHCTHATATAVMRFKTVKWDQHARRLLKKTNAELLNKLLERIELAVKQLAEMTLHRLMATSKNVII